MYNGRPPSDHPRSRPGRQRLHPAARPNNDLHLLEDRNQSAVRQNGWASDVSSGHLQLQPERPSSRLVYPDRNRSRLIASSGDVSISGGEQEFLVKVQRELEDQRESWRPEIDRLSRSTVQFDTEDRLPSLEYFPNGSGGRASSASSMDAGANSYVDTSGRVPLFKAFVDVSEFDAGDVHVTVDKMTDKIVVQARQPVSAGGVSRSFTQRVQLPRFADDERLVARMNHRGILKVNQPLAAHDRPCVVEYL